MQYDRDYPRHFDNEVEEKQCTTCKGTGLIDYELSECCGAKMDSDVMICSDCKEHAEFDKEPCPDCDGNGYIEP